MANMNPPGVAVGSGVAAPAEPADASGISADEIALYDRQIRLWGMQAQEKIRGANVLVITMRALGNEVVKNLVLAGIGSLTMLDHAPVTEVDLGAQFLLATPPPPAAAAAADPADPADPAAGPASAHVPTHVQSPLLGTNRAEAAQPAAQRLNPRVRVVADPSDIQTKGASFFAPFDIIVATDLDPRTLNLVNTAARVNNRAFYAASCHGLYGFIFADLIEHDFVIERACPNRPTKLGAETRTRSVLSVTPKPGGEAEKMELVTKRELYSTWLLASDGASLPEEVARSARRRRAVTPLLTCLRALWEFTSAHGHAPRGGVSADLVRFTALCSEKHRALGLPLDTLRSEVLRSFLQNAGTEIAPVAAVLGGQLAQDIINVLGRRQQPIQNMVVFDGNALEAEVYSLHPDGPLGRDLLEAATPVGVAAAAAGLAMGMDVDVGLGMASAAAGAGAGGKAGGAGAGAGAGGPA